MKPILLVDFGSTNTKVTAVDVDNCEILGTAAAYTTVETDINEGLANAVKILEETTGPLEFQEKYACSSAAGGLKMISIGLLCGALPGEGDTTQFGSLLSGTDSAGIQRSVSGSWCKGMENLFFSAYKRRSERNRSLSSGYYPSYRRNGWRQYRVYSVQCKGAGRFEL